MVEGASTLENLEDRSVIPATDTASTITDHPQPSNPTPTVLFEGIFKSIAETHQQLWNLLQRSLRMLSTRGKRFDASAGNDIRTTSMERKTPISELHVGSSEQPPVASRCIDEKSNSRDSISLATVSMGINHVQDTRGDARPQGEQGTRSMSMSESADFMDLDDPFACMIGARIVKNLDSALPPKHRSPNKVVETRRRLKRTVHRPQSAGRRPGSAGRRPGSAGRRPGSAGRRPGSAGRRPGITGSNSGKAPRQVELRAGIPAQTAISRGSRPRPQTPKKPPTLRMARSRLSSLREYAVSTYTDLSAKPQLGVLISPSPPLSISQLQTVSSIAVPHCSSVRTVAFRQRPKVAFSSRTTPL